MKHPQAKEARALHAKLDALLAGGLDNQALRVAIEELARDEPLFGAVAYRVAQRLLQRDHVLFSPLLRPRLRTYGIDPRGQWTKVWQTSPYRAHLDWIIDHADHQGDDDLFRAALSVWLNLGDYRDRDRRFSEALMGRLRVAASLTAKLATLERFTGLYATIDEAAAIEIYGLDRERTKPFLREFLPRRWGSGDDKSDLLSGLREVVRPHDEAFYYELLRRTSTFTAWRDRVREVLRHASDADLPAYLERIHPIGYVQRAPDVFADILDERSEAGLPYVTLHTHQILRGGWSYRTGYRRLARLTRKLGYDGLWSAILRYGAREEDYNAAVIELTEAGDHARERLLRLAGVARETNFPGFGLARLQPLSDDAACALYATAPALLHGPFKPHLFVGWRAAYPKLVEAALDAADEPMIDYIASRLVTRAGSHSDVADVAKRLSAYYEARIDEPTFAERAANVLGQVPAFTLTYYDHVLTGNRLTRLLYEHALDRYLTSAVAIRDLLEASEIHAQRVAFRALALDLDRARKLALSNLDLLGPTLLRPLHRRTRLIAFDALCNAAHTEAGGRRVLELAREALHLPDHRYPKEELVGLLGQVLARHPSLRTDRERPVVYRRTP